MYRILVIGDDLELSGWLREAPSLRGCEVQTAAIVYHFRDPGPGFRRDALPHAGFANPPEDPLRQVECRASQGLRPGGFGILIAAQLVDELTYNEAGNEVLLIKHTK